LPFLFGVQELPSPIMVAKIKADVKLPNIPEGTLAASNNRSN